MTTTRQPVPLVPYHRTLARPAGTWRLLLVIVLCPVGLVLLSVVSLLTVSLGAAALGYDLTLDITDGINAGELLATNVGLALLTPYAMLVTRALYGVPPRWLSSNRPGLRWHWLLVCVGVALVVYSVFLVLGTAGAAAERDSPLDAAVIAVIGVVLLTTPLQAAGEEYLFRGLLLQALGAVGIPTWGCYVGSGLLFALAHFQFAPELLVDRFLLGVAFGYLAVHTGGLEAPIALHAVKNVSVLIPAALLEQTDDALDPTGVTWIPVVFDVAMLAILVPWMVQLSRRRNGPQPQPPSGGPRPSGLRAGGLRAGGLRPGAPALSTRPEQVWSYPPTQAGLGSPPGSTPPRLPASPRPPAPPPPPPPHQPGKI